MERIGIYGGTFDPLHDGHVAVARIAFAQLELDELLWIPNASPPHKGASESRLSPQRRLKMCEQVCAGQAGWKAVDWELRRPGPSYTADTLRQAHELYPNSTVWLILGADAAAGLPGWHRGREVLELASLAVVARVGDDAPIEVVDQIKAWMPEAQLRAVSADAPDVSSTAVRERVRGGEHPAALPLPGPVALLLEAWGAYRAPAAVSTA